MISPANALAYGVSLVLVGVLALVWSVNLLTGFLVLLAAFLWRETRAAEPILPLRLFRSRVFSVANAMGFTIGMTMFGALRVAPLI